MSKPRRVLSQVEFYQLCEELKKGPDTISLKEAVPVLEKALGFQLTIPSVRTAAQAVGIKTTHAKGGCNRTQATGVRRLAVVLHRLHARLEDRFGETFLDQVDLDTLDYYRHKKTLPESVD